MEIQEQIKKFGEFIEGFYKEQLLKRIKKDERFLLIDFSELTKFEPELADDLLDAPEEVIKAAEIAIEQLDAPGEVRGFKARFFHLPKTLRKSPHEIASKDINKFISLVGNVGKSTPRLFYAKSGKFECPACSAPINILFLDRKFREPTRCGCGRKGKFRLLDAPTTDTIKLGIYDDLMDDRNENKTIARDKVAILENDLAIVKNDRYTKLGKKIVINGYFTYERKDDVSSEYIATFNANSIEVIEVGWDTVIVTEAEENQIEVLSQEPDIILKLARSISDFQGHDEVLISNLLQLAGAPHKYDKNGILSSRGTIHVLIAGDTGVNKTGNAKQVGDICPISAFYSAANASGKGLVVAVDKDKELGTWVMIPGVVVICSGGIAIIDELDKTHEDDYGDHNHAMNECIVPVAKGTVKGELIADTSYLGLANPKHRNFIDVGYDTNYDQINMPKDFLDRFDIIWAIETESNKEKRDKIIDVMLERHLGEEESKENKWQPEFEHNFIRKYVASCRRKKPAPLFKKGLIPYVKEKVYELMKPKQDEQIKISNRQIEVIMRLAYASARLKRRDVAKEDIDLACNLKKESFRQLGILNEIGYNWGAEERIQDTQINETVAIKTVINELIEKVGNLIPIDEIVDMCKTKGVNPDKTEEIITKLSRAGDYFEPRRGFISKL